MQACYEPYARGVRPLLVIVVCLLLFFCACDSDQDGAGGHGDEHAHGHGEGEDRGGKAVNAADEKRGIKLEPIARARMGILFAPLQGPGPYGLRADQVVHSEDRTFVYIEVDGWIRQVDVTARDGRYRLRLDDRFVAPRIVKTGAAFVHLAYLEAFGAAGSGHAH